MSFDKKEKEKIEYISSNKAVCKGDEKSAHPLVYYDLSNKDVVICGYCSKKFIRK